MVNAPTTRPPARPRSVRRPPKGPTMARTSAETYRAHLTVASERLRASGDEFLAGKLDDLVEPGGWQLLKPPATTSKNANLPISMKNTERDRLKELSAKRDKALAAAGEKQVGLTGDVNEGFRLFVAGDFVPDAPVRATRNSGATAEAVVLNVRPDADLVQQVKDIAPARSAEYGWNVTPARVAAAYLLKKYKISAAKA